MKRHSPRRQQLSTPVIAYSNDSLSGCSDRSDVIIDRRQIDGINMSEHVAIIVRASDALLISADGGTP